MNTVAGKGSMEHPLSDAEIRQLCTEALTALDLRGKKVLVLIPDHTRHARLELFFRTLHEVLDGKVAALDYLVATGTHVAMEPERIYAHVGITAEEHRTTFRSIRFFNHEHDNPAALATIGHLPGEELLTLTNGLFSEPIEVTINKKALEYDHLLLITPVVPHEAMGFAGGNKYFFPGIAGLAVIETFHWLAAIITNPVVNGVKDTPTRNVINRAAEFLPTPRTCFAFAVNENDQPMCLFIGEPKEAFSRAADYSTKLHITYAEQPYKTILAVTPPIYEDMWVGGKAMYKLEPVVADGGEVIIYGPQIRSISFMHEQAIRRIGYHVIEYFTRQWERFSREPRLIMAHSTNVRGIGTFRNGVEYPRVQVTLATSIPEDVCKSVNLGYRDYKRIDIETWKTRANGDLMVVENAGQNLYRLSGKSTP